MIPEMSPTCLIPISNTLHRSRREWVENILFQKILVLNLKYLIYHMIIYIIRTIPLIVV